MKKTAFLSVVGLTMFLAACGDDNETATNVPDDAPTEQETNSSDTIKDNNSADAPFMFTHFNLSVDYAGNKSYDIDYENESTGAEAKIEDDFNNKVVQGNEAVDELVPIFEKFSFDAATDNDKIIDEVLNALNLSTDYQEFDLEVRFVDGVEKEVKHTQ